MANYYEDVSKKLSTLIDNNNFEAALKIINEELLAPYIPEKFEKYLQTWNDYINEHMELSQRKLFSWSLEKVVYVMKNENDQHSHLVAFDFLRELNARKIIDDISEYLINPINSDENKTFLLMILIEQKIDKEFVIVKNNYKFAINPIKFNVKESQLFLKNIEKNIENLLYHYDPSLFNISLNILNSYYYFKFPSFSSMHLSLNDLTIAIILKTFNAMGISPDPIIINSISFDHTNVMLILRELDDMI
ncbi:DUF3196 family protein [Spiroplasma turonicum]|uniref:Uncharacterized protein n=1 Tax=Spiroplasma turonicum TaxID=216946 RepID=A0A0K1P6X1_9MOLU|nr:DUF3196 family protein [Spiroplasma turonicum]AKU80056.1 hypothetical protein STURON_00810 [Spiroplasma turonicum]ALX71058.1 hypothetical protein STURO_v1c08070 [Spiroplasma turonicum]